VSAPTRGTYQPPLTEKTLTDIAAAAKEIVISRWGLMDWLRFTRPERTYVVKPGTLAPGAKVEYRLSVTVDGREVPALVNNGFADGEYEIHER
jgi:hypothetical protein